MFTRRRGFRPRSDYKSTILFGVIVGVVSGYYIFFDPTNVEIRQDQKSGDIPVTIDELSAKKK